MQIAFVIISRLCALVIDTPTAIFLRMVMLGQKKFTFKGLQHLEMILCAAALYTVCILGIRTFADPILDGNLFIFASTQWYV